ncbi:MAG: hypothetical protein ACYDBQ_10055 [Thermoplasmatota archaeon]
MLYIDSNLVVYAHMDGGERGDKARQRLRDARDGRRVCTSALTLDDLMGSVQKTKGKTHHERRTAATTRFPVDPSHAAWPPRPQESPFTMDQPVGGKALYHAVT